MRRLFTVLAVLSLSLGVAFGFSLAGAGAVQAKPYSQVVDNATKGRFAAPGWKASSYSTTRYGKNYRYAVPKAKGKPARYKVRIPKAGNYTVFARWPSNNGYNGAAKFGVVTTSGTKWKKVDQRKNGGRWMKLGVYRMRAGNAYSVRVSRNAPGKKYVIADAIKVVQGNAKSAGGSGGGNSGGGNNGGQTNATAAKIVKEAKTWIGTPYKYGGTTRKGVDCSGLTLKVYGKFGIKLPRTSGDQYHAGRKVTSPRAGDLVFFGKRGDVQSVGIVTGKNRMIKATVPGEKVHSMTISSVGNAVGMLGYRRVL